MTEFKKGDRIVFTKADAWGKRGERVRMPKGTLGTYDDADGGAAPWVRLDTGERVQAWADVLAPAPLDPSKVKAGDTVTVRVEPNPGTGWGTLDHGPEAIEVTGKVWLDSGDNPHGPVAKVGVHALGLPNVTLTAHQPAPEPEPEWKPGQFVSGVVEGARRQGMVDDLGNFLFWNHELEGVQEDPIAPGVVTDIRPLVVIDPADVDRVALQREIDDAMPGHEASVVLERLGLNR
jgi:hypothetical protein